MGIIILILNLNNSKFIDKPKNVNIISNKLSLSKYSNDFVSINIPSGWKTETAGDYTHYTLKIYNPENTAYQIFMNLKTEGYMKSVEAKNFFRKYYGDTNIFARMPVLSNQTTDGFYSIFNELGSINNTPTFTFPILNDFNIIENFGTTIYGGDLLRATFINENNNEGEGLFTATVKSPGDYYVNSDITNMFSAKIDTYPLNVYNTIFITTPINELVNWESTLINCLNSLEYSDTFVKGFQKEQDNLLQTIKANSKTYNEISDMIMSSWESKNKSYDIISQKNSDSTLGYERVYDKETGEIYKAYNGFIDNYSGERYEKINDDMYTKKISGYIEKK